MTHQRKTTTRSVLLIGLLLLFTATFALAKDKDPKPELDNDHWIVFDSETFYPVFDELHAALNTAYSEYLNKNYNVASDHLRAGADELRVQAEELPDNLAFKSRAAASKLDTLATKMQRGSVGPKELQFAIERAYLADENPQWLASENWEVIDYLDKPGLHISEALMNYKQGKYVDAAFDLNQAAAYMELVQGPGPESRELRRLAHEVTLPKNERPDLKTMENDLIEVSRAFADNQMDQAIQARNLNGAKTHLKAGVASAKNVQLMTESEKAVAVLETAIHKAEGALSNGVGEAKQEIVKSAHELRDALDHY